MRIDVYNVWPDGYAAMQQLEAAVRGSGLEHSSSEKGEAAPPFSNPPCVRLAPRAAPPARDASRAVMCVTRRTTFDHAESEVAVNSWNRLGITAAGKVGGYVAGSL